MSQSRSNTGKSSSVYCGRLVPGSEAQFRKTQQCSPWPVLRTDAGRGLQQQIGFARLPRPPAVLGDAQRTNCFGARQARAGHGTSSDVDDDLVSRV